MKDKKILIVGNFSTEIYEKPLAKAFQNLGLIVHCFKTEYLKEYDSILIKKFINFQIKLGFGPYLFFINLFLTIKLLFTKYDFIFFYRPVIINKVNFYLSNKKSIVFIYNNDDPFSKNYKTKIWKKYYKGLKYAHHIFYYREKNKNDYELLGFKNTSLLRSYYIKERNFPIENLQKNQYSADISFIGHFENDGRDVLFKSLIDAGLNLKIFGTGWQKSIYYRFFLSKIGNIYPIYEDYNLAINSAKICLVLFSKLNNDNYTRRVFEITATKTAMFSEETETMKELFESGKEAIYFKTSEDLIKKLKFFLLNLDLLKEVGESGNLRLINSSHEIQDRAKNIFNVYNEISKKS